MSTTNKLLPASLLKKAGRSILMSLPEGTMPRHDWENMRGLVRRTYSPWGNAAGNAISGAMTGASLGALVGLLRRENPLRDAAIGGGIGAVGMGAAGYYGGRSATRELDKLKYEDYVRNMEIQQAEAEQSKTA